MNYENEQTCNRDMRSRKDIMTEDTRKYGDWWIGELERIAGQRAKQGIFPREFPCGQTESEVERCREEIANAILGCYQNQIKPEGKNLPVIVLLGGGGAAGKTTFCLELIDHLQKKDARLKPSGKIGRLELDNYFYPLDHIGDRASDGKYDNPRNSDLLRARQNLKSLRERKKAVIPVHDRRNHESRNQSFLRGDDLDKLVDAAIIIVEGLYCLGPDLHELGDVCVYIDASSLDRAKGRVWRDIIVREREEEHVIEMLMGRETYHQTFVEPTQMVADYIFRRPETGGYLRVVYDSEIEEAFRDACQKILKLTKTEEDELFREFNNLQMQATERRAKETEF